MPIHKYGESRLTKILKHLERNAEAVIRAEKHVLEQVIKEERKFIAEIESFLHCHDQTRTLVIASEVIVSAG